jgi:hypothetical protein
MNVPPAVEAKKVMDSDPVHPRPNSRSPAAEPMRLHRKRYPSSTEQDRIRSDPVVTTPPGGHYFFGQPCGP